MTTRDEADRALGAAVRKAVLDDDYTSEDVYVYAEDLRYTGQATASRVMRLIADALKESDQ